MPLGGTGTRPRGADPRNGQVERLARRVGLDDGSYQAALDKLRDLTAGNRKPVSLAEELRRRAGA